MKNKSKFAKELIITLIVASLLSGVMTFILSFTFANLGVLAESRDYVVGVGAAIWGLFVGFKTNTLLRDYR